MATGQTLLNRLEAVDDDLDLQSGETDVTHGLIWLNAAQDYFESIVALHRNCFGSGVSTVSTSASTETSAWPTNFLRIDKLQMLNSSTSLPQWDIEIVEDVGGHLYDISTYHSQYNTSSTGEPRQAWLNGTNVYWGPIPNGTHTVRVYGFASAGDITAGGTFAYPDIVIQPIVEFAGSMAQRKVDDGEENYQLAAEVLFTPVIELLSHYNRAGLSVPVYTRSHYA